MKTSDFYHKASDGKAIFVRKWLPSGAPKALLLVAHGMAEHSARYERLATAMIQSGWAVYVPDHRGHGKTAQPGELGWLAEKDGFIRLRDDLHEIALVAKEECGGAPLFLLGHSMGSVLAETYIVAYGKDLAGCVLSGVVAPLPRPLSCIASLIASAGGAIKGRKTQSKLLHAMSFSANNKDFEPARSPVDWLSRDEAEVDKYIADPLCGFVCSFGFYRDLLGGLSFLYARNSPFTKVPKDLPLFIISGAEDPVGGAKGFVPRLAAILKAAGLQRIETRLYPGARHEVLNETNKEEVLKDVKDWLDSAFAEAGRRP